ncbi:MAG: NAD-dependent epimerase/dehydratase family protein [Thermoplasmatota archaeon]
MSGAKRVLITGSSGQIGSWVMDLVPPGILAAPLDIRGPDSVDIRSEAARKAVAAAEVVIHLAARVNVVESMRDPEPTWDTNVRGTENLLGALRPKTRFVFISSAAVYGEPQSVPIAENHPLAPLSPYGQTKAEGEKLVATLAPERGASWTILRPFNVYSSRQDPSSSYAGVIARFVMLAQAGRPLTVRGDGRQTRDFVHASDVARAIWSAALGERCASTIMNVGTGRPASILDVAEAVQSLVGHVGVEYAEGAVGEIVHSVGNVGRAAAVLDWRPRIALADGLREVLGRTLPEERHA